MSIYKKFGKYEKTNGMSFAPLSSDNKKHKNKRYVGKASYKIDALWQSV